MKMHSIKAPVKVTTTQPQLHLRRSTRLKPSMLPPLPPKSLIDAIPASRPPLPKSKRQQEDAREPGNHVKRFLPETPVLIENEPPAPPAKPLTEIEKMNIAIEYHLMTHENTDYVIRKMRSNGFDWDDLEDIVRKVDDLCIDCELDKPAPAGVSPLKMIRSDHVWHTVTCDLMFFSKNSATRCATVERLWSLCCQQSSARWP